MKTKPLTRIGTAAAVLLLLVAVPAHAGFFQKAVGFVKSVVAIPGQVVGAAIGGLVGSATAPTINQAERAGKNLIHEANAALEQRIADLNQVAKDRLLQMDSILGQRIGDINKVMEDRINQVDTVMAARTEQLDEMLKDRIAQIDQVAETRIANIDIVATKAALTLEESILRVVAIGCIMVFIALAAWMIYKEAVQLWPPIAASAASLGRKLGRLFVAVWPRIVGRVALAATIAVMLWGTLAFLPGGAQRRREVLVDSHLRALNEHLAGFDFKNATFEAAQLKALDSTDARLVGARLKTELLRDLFTRPTVAQKETGLVGLFDRVAEVERHLGKEHDPDVQAIKGLILWRSAGNKVFEHFAAASFASALELAAERRFVLEPLARSYLDAYLDAPICEWVLTAAPEVNATITQWRAEAAEILGKRTAAYDVAKIRSVATAARATPAKLPGRSLAADLMVPAPLRPYLQYNNAVMQLRRVSSEKYVSMVAAFAAGAAGKVSGQQAATALVGEWKQFGERLLADAAMEDAVNLRLAPLLLNDAVEARAGIYATATFADKADVPARAVPQPVLRMRLEPYLKPLFAKADTTRKLMNWQESRRFYAYEDSALEFEKAYVDFRRCIAEKATDVRVIESAFKAAKVASALGLYAYEQNSARPLAEKILEEAKIDHALLTGRFRTDYAALLDGLTARQLGVL